jgi:hypothetical protein
MASWPPPQATSALTFGLNLGMRRENVRHIGKRYLISMRGTQGAHMYGVMAAIV